MGRLRYPYRLGSRFPARRPDHYTLDPYLVLDIPFHEGAGSLVEDRSIHKNIGTISDGTWKAQGIRGACLELDGDDDYVDCGDATILDITDELTIEAWINWSGDNAENYRAIVDRQRYPNTVDSYALVFNEDSKLHLGTAGGNMQSTQTTWTIGTWYHIIATYKATGLIGHLYINGKDETLSVDSLNTMAGGINNVCIGRWDDKYFDGLTDEIRILNRDLSAQEVLDRYEAYKL